MNYQELDDLERAMAKLMFVIEASDMMVPAKESRATVDRMAERSDKATGPEQFDPDIQQWRAIKRSAGCALIALRKLGYCVVKEDIPPG